MRITLKNDLLQLCETEDLKKYQISQLEYYGFKKINGIFQKKTSSDTIILNISEVIEFFETEKLSFVPEANIKQLLNELKQEKKVLSKLFEKAKRIKNGFVNSQDFRKFKSFLDSLPRNLKPHQVKAAFHLYTLKSGANFSVPGSGKTSVVLSVYEKLRFENKCNILFVIGPPSCFQPWKNEFKETLGRIPYSIVLSGEKKEERRAEYFKAYSNRYELYLTTFQSILNDINYVISFLTQSDISVFLVVDEAHYIKQIGGSWSNALLNLSKYVKYKCVLTGTPIPRSYQDIFNLFDFLWNGNSPLELKDKTQICLLEKNKKDEAVKSLLNSKIGGLFYRVRKKDLSLISPKFHRTILVTMNRNEQIIYSYIKARILDLSSEDYFKNEEVLNQLWKGRMVRLRQALSYPKLLLSAIDHYKERLINNEDLASIIKNYDRLEIPGKLISLSELVMKLRKNGEKVLIWSNFIGTLQLLKAYFISLGENCELIYGKTPMRKGDDKELDEEKTREDIRDEFMDKDSGLNILIANPAACAESISLHKSCFHAVYYDLSYNCAQYIQSLDRIHRVGGSEIHQANYYFLQYRDSIDQDIKDNLEKKAKRMYSVIEQDYTIYDLNLYDETNDDDIASYKRLFHHSHTSETFITNVKK